MLHVVSAWLEERSGGLHIAVTTVLCPVPLIPTTLRADNPLIQRPTHPSTSPVGSYNEFSGTTYTIDDCVCAPGFYGAGGNDCTACADGTYTSEFGSASESDCVKALKVCLLVPSFVTATGLYRHDGHHPLSGALHAIKEINDKSDGVWDDVLPDTNIVYEWYNSDFSAAVAIQMAIECVTTAFGGTRADVVVGPNFSGLSMSAQRVLSTYNVPQISHAATSPTLSDNIEYPTFSRTPPSVGPLSTTLTSCDRFRARASAPPLLCPYPTPAPLAPAPTNAPPLRTHTRA